MVSSLTSRWIERGVTAAMVGALAATTLSTSDPLPANSSLPLKGDVMPTGDGAAPDGTAFGVGSRWNVFNWGPGIPASTPQSFAYNYVNAAGETVKKIYVGTQSNQDAGLAKPIINMSTSLDSGVTFLKTDRESTYNVTNAVRLTDGTFLSPAFIPEWLDQSKGLSQLLVWKSVDGINWTQFKAPVSSPPEYQFGPMSFGLRVHKRTTELADGTLLVPAYTVFKGTSKQRSMILQSTDKGAHWSLRSVIPATSEPGTNETAITYTSDGRMLAVMRTTHLPETHLVYSWSDDDGKTWAEAKELLGPDGTNVHGIFPDLILQPNGTLLLLTGRPDVQMLVSNDGTGKTWDIHHTVFANYPSTGNNGRYDGTSGNNTMESVSNNRAVVFYDQCTVWGCGAFNEQPGVSAQYAAAVTPGAGKIDVNRKLATGTATLTGTFAKPDKRFPEMRPRGAFDGSSAYGAEARLTSTSNSTAPSLTLTLDRTYPLNRIGLMLGHGNAAESATIQLSSDGKTWSAPVVTATNTRDWAMRYVNFPAQDAKYVKITGPAAKTTTVTEVELYAADVDTFENELPYAIPRGWTGAEHAWVTDVPDNLAYGEFGAHDSTTALRLFDKWTDSNAHINRPTPDTQHLNASMQWGGSDFRAHFTFGTAGKTTDGTNTTAWKFRLTQGNPATLEAWNGTAWTTVGKLTTALPTRTYLPLTLNATPTKATITIGTNTFTTTTRAADTTTLNTLQLATGEPAEYGGMYLIDDVRITTD